MKMNIRICVKCGYAYNEEEVFFDERNICEYCQYEEKQRELQLTDDLTDRVMDILRYRLHIDDADTDTDELYSEIREALSEITQTTQTQTIQAI